MTTETNDVVVVEAGGLIRVCAWCVSQRRLEQLARAYPCQITHAMCPGCIVRFERQTRSA